jgi:antitoxin VapB
MAMHINSPDVERDVRKLATVTGETLTEAVGASVRERLRRLRPREDRKALLRDVSVIVRKVGKLPTLDERSDDEILGYNEHGHFD